MAYRAKKVDWEYIEDVYLDTLICDQGDDADKRHRIRVALHEAAHFVLSVQQDLLIRWVLVTPVKLPKRSKTQVAGNCQTWFDGNQSEAEIIVTIAGIEIERLMLGEMFMQSNTWRSDERDLQGLLSRNTTVDPEALTLEVREFIVKKFALIEMTAKALIICSDRKGNINKFTVAVIYGGVKDRLKIQQQPQRNIEWYAALSQIPA